MEVAAAVDQITASSSASVSSSSSALQTTARGSSQRRGGAPGGDGGSNGLFESTKALFRKQLNGVIDDAETLCYFLDEMSDTIGTPTIAFFDSMLCRHH